MVRMTALDETTREIVLEAAGERLVAVVRGALEAS
jgi:hypothetical protein